MLHSHHTSPLSSAFDAIVYGGTSAGVTAAIQLARMGKTVVLIEPGRHVGGLTISGLGYTDAGDKTAIGGLAREFYRRIKLHYDQPQSWTCQNREEFERYRPADDTMWVFEPRIAENTLAQMLDQANVPVSRGQRLKLDDGVRLQAGRIASIAMESGQTFSAKMFIDATYEGDLLAKSGVSCTIGRESNATYGETLNGVQVACARHHQFQFPVDPYVKPGDPSTGLLPGISAQRPPADGSGDRQMQAYCFRLCLTNNPHNRVEFAKPDGYDPAEYELLLRHYEAGDREAPMFFSPMPNAKTDSNNRFAVSLDYIGQNHDYPQADYQRRDQIIAAHQRYQMGLLWTLVNHPRVPENVRDQMRQWGLAADEFTDNRHWPYTLYIRESRRMVSDYVMTEADCRHQTHAQDPVGMASYQMDSHHVQRYVDEHGHVRNEGDVEVATAGAFGISYRAIVPRQGQCPNLLVPVCLSASHIAYGSVRMEPVFMVLGQSAGAAAALAIDSGCSVQALDYAALRHRLLDDGQVLQK